MERGKREGLSAFFGGAGFYIALVLCVTALCAAGYFLLGGIRYVYDVPDFSARYFHHIARRPYDFNAFRNVLRETTGKGMKQVYREIADTMAGIWASEIREREPFIPSGQIVRTPYRYTEYSRNVILDGNI